MAGIVFLGSYPASDLSSTDLAALSIYGSQDGVLNRGNYESAYSHLPANASEIIIDGGNHAGFGDYGTQSGDGEATISRGEQQRITADAIATFMED